MLNSWKLHNTLHCSVTFRSVSNVLHSYLHVKVLCIYTYIRGAAARLASGIRLAHVTDVARTSGL
jgi:hypothetical protein